MPDAERDTIDVGYVHVLTEHGGPCIANCPHPDHGVTPLEFLIEDLEDLLVAYDESGHLFGSSGAGAYFLAEHIVASDWFKRVTG